MASQIVFYRQKCTVMQIECNYNDAQFSSAAVKKRVETSVTNQAFV